MASFVERFTDLASRRSPLCLGLDPSQELLGLWGLKNDAEGLRRFCGSVLEAADESLILAPGVGAQGADMAEVGTKFRSAQERVLPSVSRAILRHGPSPVALRDAIERYREAAWTAWDAEASLAAS